MSTTSSVVLQSYQNHLKQHTCQDLIKMNVCKAKVATRQQLHGGRKTAFKLLTDYNKCMTFATSILKAKTNKLGLIQQ